MLEVRDALLVSCKLMNERFPEFDAWLEDSKNDVAFRKAWYKDHYLNTPVDVFDEGDFDDEDYDDEVLDYDEESITVVRHQPTVGRNDPCPCGSGKKFKKCCLNKPKTSSLERACDSFLFSRSDADAIRPFSLLW